MLLAVAAALQAVSSFNPPLDRPIAYTVSEVREQGAIVQRFAVDRRVTFHRRAGGFVAEVETLRTRTTSDARPANMLQAATAGMIGRHVILLLDAGGSVVEVEDRAAVWAAQVDGLEKALAGAKPGPQAATVGSLVAPLRAMTPPQQTRRIGDMLAPLVGSDLLAQGVRPARAVSVPTRGLDGAAIVLSGSEATRRTGDALEFERTLAGGGKRSHLLRRVDPRSGLVRETVDTTETGVGESRITITRSTVISP